MCPIDARNESAAWPVQVPSLRAATSPVAVIPASWAAVWKAPASDGDIGGHGGQQVLGPGVGERIGHRSSIGRTGAARK